jgi:DNA-binding transcriptional regulator YhcF (GntR family)
MTETNVQKTPSDDTLRVNEKKWGKPLMDAGWTVLPNIIFERQKALGLDAIDVNILLHIASYWWAPEGRPHPSKVTIAKAMGIDPRTVQRHIAEMEKGGMIKRQERRVTGLGSRTNIYHLDGLIASATPYAKEKLEEREAKAKDKADKAQRKGKPKLRVVRTDE